jgi:cytochrome c-type biogenesis protein
MQYFISFLEGIITFISPCLLPMLPIYLSYFAGGEQNSSSRRTVKNALGFVLGFTLVFIAMGALTGTVGSFFKGHQTLVNLVCGFVIILFGLHYLGLLKLNLFRGMRRSVQTQNLGFFSSLLFGVVFSVGWTPCVGAFLGSALMLASQQGQALIGILMLLCYSLGLGIPFVISAVLVDRLKGAFDLIKRNYRVINLVCGCLLILVGILMMTGLLGRFLTLLS